MRGERPPPPVENGESAEPGDRLTGNELRIGPLCPQTPATIALPAREGKGVGHAMTFWPIKWSDLKSRRRRAEDNGGRWLKRPAFRDVPAMVYVLAENLDAVLATGEDLLLSAILWNSTSTGTRREMAAARRDQRQAFEHIRTLEMMLVSRALASRERASDLAAIDPRFAVMTRLYIGGTALLLDAVTDVSQALALEFDGGTAMTAYLRNRNVLPAGLPAPEDGTSVIPGDGFLIAGHVPLGDLMDLAGMFLDTLETHYNIFEDADGDAPPSTSPDDA